MRKWLLGFTALLLIPAGAAVANYAVTLGSGTNFGSIVGAGTVHYAQQLICDFVTPAQCVNVSAAGAMKVDGSGATQPVSGSLTNISGTISLPTGASTLAAQNTGNTSLATIATNTAAVPTGASTSALQTSGNASLTTIAANTAAVPTGAATSALQGTGNTSLGTIVTNTTGASTLAAQNTGNAALAAIAANTGAPVPILAGPTTGGTAQPQIGCTAHAFLHITTAATANIVPGVTAQNVYVCGWRSRAAGAATWFLAESSVTGAVCTTNTQMTGVATEAANTGEVMNPAFWSGLKTAAAGHGVCITSTGTGGVDVDLWYTQF